MDLVIERFRRQDAIPLPCKRSWRTIVDVLCDAFEAVEKMDLVIILSREAQSFRACGKDVRGQSSTTITFLSSPLAFSHNSSLRASTLSHLVVDLQPFSELSSLLSEPLLSHLLVDLQPFSGNLLSDDIRTIPCTDALR